MISVISFHNSQYEVTKRRRVEPVVETTLGQDVTKRPVDQQAIINEARAAATTTPKRGAALYAEIQSSTLSQS